jgi:hypothetical protein
MGYDGEYMTHCGAVEMDCSLVKVVAVSGDFPNPCGHLLIATNCDHYFHVAEIRGYPKYMADAGYRRYLKETKKSEIRRRSLALPDPDAAKLYLENLMANTWTWGGIPNNCVTFVEEVIAAGGATWSSYSNCPSIATAETIGERATRFLNQLENEIYRMYGFPRL